MTPDERANKLIADGDMRVEIVKREINQGALAGMQSEITDQAAALVIVALDSFDDYLEQRVRKRIANRIHQDEMAFAALSLTPVIRGQIQAASRRAQRIALYDDPKWTPDRPAPETREETR